MAVKRSMAAVATAVFLTAGMTAAPFLATAANGRDAPKDAPRAGKATDPWLVVEGGKGPGKDRHIVLIAGDEEYRSEEALPQLAKILARRQGFTCTVLFPIDPKDGTINPNVRTNIPGLEKLAGADLMVLFTRHRDLPDEQMKHVVDSVESGRPVVGLRIATHAFALSSPTYRRYTWDGRERGYEGGFGRQVLGATWAGHHGAPGKEGTRGVITGSQDRGHPILRGIEPTTLFAPSHVFAVRLPQPADCSPLVVGQVTDGAGPAAKAVAGPKNDPMMPVAWTTSYAAEGGKVARVFTTTMGAAEDLAHEGTRRLIVNACLWAVGLEDQIPVGTDVGLVGGFKPGPSGVRPDAAWKPGVRPSDLAK